MRVVLRMGFPNTVESLGAERRLEGEIPFACDHRSAYQGLCKNSILILRKHTEIFFDAILSKLLGINSIVIVPFFY